MKVSSNGTVRRTESEWRGVMGQWEASGLSRREFCKREGIVLSSFTRWHRRVSMPAMVRRSETFVDVTPTPMKVSGTWMVELELPHGCVLRFRG